MRIESERLYLRRFQIEDRENIWRLHKDPDVMKYTRMKRAFSREESFQKLKEIIGDLPKHDPLGMWAAFLKEGDEFVGWFGFWASEFDSEPELGFMIRQDMWGNGYTTEAAEAILNYYQKPRVHALTSHDNFASQRVLEKLGFKFLKENKDSKHFVKMETD